MKRFVAAAIGICVVGSVWAQGSFTIVRPADGSKVREKIRVLIPKNSIEDNAYVGVFVGGKFVEATAPPVDSSNPNYRVYTLDTKARQIPDGALKLELVKYSGGDSPRVVDRSSVEVTVANHSISVPEGGFKLRYSFAPGRQLVYKMMENVTVSTLSGLDNSLGGHAAELPTGQDLTARIMYAVDNAYSDGQALLRMQFLPDKGKDYTILLVKGEAEPRKVTADEMAPVYMRVKSTGTPIYGTVPLYFGFQEGGTGGTFENVFSVWPLPVLPDRAVAPGSSWQTGYQLPAVDDKNMWTLNRVSHAYPARGEFVDVEWEMGHPCAKLRNSIAEGTRSFEGMQLEKAGRAFGDDKVALEETIWFALDARQIIKRVRTITIDQKVKVQQQTQGGGAGPGGPGAANGPGRPSAAGNSGGAVGAAGFTNPPVPPAGLNLQGPRGAGPRGGGGLQGGPQQGMGGGMGQRSGGGGAAGKTQYIRARYQQIFVIEQ